MYGPERAISPSFLPSTLHPPSHVCLPPSLPLPPPGSSAAPSTNTAVEEGSVPKQQTRRKKLTSRRSRTPPSPIPLEELDISQPPRGAGGGEENASDRTSPDVRMEVGQNGMESGHVFVRAHTARTSSTLDTTSRSPNAKIRLSGSFSLPVPLPPTVIEEPAMEEGLQEGDGSSTPIQQRRMRLQRSPSPTLQIPPSPVKMSPKTSPNMSPRNNRKTRIATRRRGSRCEWSQYFIDVAYS